jgi:hypothetical protein
MDFRTVGFEDGTDLVLYSLVDFGVASVKLSGFATRVLVSQPIRQLVIYLFSYFPQ